jgi:hypothetical protein
LELINERGLNENQIRALLDCEFSYAKRTNPNGDYDIQLSTLPWREGKALGCSWIESVASGRNSLADLSLTAEWRVENLWHA